MLQTPIFNDFARAYAVLPNTLRRKICYVFGLISLQAIFEVLTILCISLLAMVIIHPERILIHPIMIRVHEVIPYLKVLQEDARYFAILSAFLSTSVIIFKNLITATCSFFSARLGAHISLYAGEVIFSHFLYSPYITHLAGDSSKMFMGLSWRSQLGNMMIRLMNFYTYLAVTIALVLTLIFFVPASVLIVLILLGTASITIYRAIRNSVDNAGKSSTEWGRESTKATMNAMSGIRETLIYRQQEVFFEHFKNACLGGMKPNIYLSLVPSIPVWILESLGFLTIPISMIVMLISSDATIAQMTSVLTMIMLIAWRVLPMLNRSMGALVAVRSSRHAAMDCLELVEKAKAEPAPERIEPDPNFSFQRQISFEDVAFCYPNAEQNCLENLSFTIHCGQRLGIVGKSGAGKSSIAALLSGLVEPTNGKVLIDGKELTPEERAAYCTKLGYVPQNPYILAGSIAENVAFSAWGKPWDAEKVIQVCKMAELEIAESRGIDTNLGQSGTSLSGGQAQRVSIARALYCNPSILIFDEATSALDTGIETSIMNTIYALPEAISVVIIAHRLSTVQNCDILIWIDKGKIRQIGTPAQVLPEYERFLKNSS